MTTMKSGVRFHRFSDANQFSYLIFGEFLAPVVSCRLAGGLFLTPARETHLRIDPAPHLVTQSKTTFSTCPDTRQKNGLQRSDDG